MLNYQRVKVSLFQKWSLHVLLVYTFWVAMCKKINSNIWFWLKNWYQLTHVVFSLIEICKSSRFGVKSYQHACMSPFIKCLPSEP